MKTGQPPNRIASGGGNWFVPVALSIAFGTCSHWSRSPKAVVVISACRFAGLPQSSVSHSSASL